MLFKNCSNNNDNHICLYNKLLSDIASKQTLRKTTPQGNHLKNEMGAANVYSVLFTNVMRNQPEIIYLQTT